MALWGMPLVALNTRNPWYDPEWDATQESGGGCGNGLFHFYRTMGSSSSVPKGSLLGHLLTHWNQFGLQDLKKKRLIFCNNAWAHYSLRDEEKWSINATINLNTIRQLDIFCRKQGKWTKVPYVRAFMTLNQDRDIRASYRMCLATKQVNKPPLDILDDCLNRSPPSNKPGLPEESSSSSDKGDIDSVTIPPISPKTLLLPTQLGMPGMEPPSSRSSSKI